MKSKLLFPFLVSLIVATLSAGCSEINLKINIHPDLSADFSELINLDQKLAAIMDQPQGTGADIWETLPRFAKIHNWTYKEKASNQLLLTGNVPAGQLSLLEKDIIDELATIAHSYGIGYLPAEEMARLLPRSYKLEVRDYFFVKTYEIIYDCDLSADGLSKRMQIPPLWKAVMGAKLPEYLTLNLQVTAPWTTIATNGAPGATSKTTNWTVYFGRHNRLQATYRAYDWPKIFVCLLLLIALVAFILKKFAKQKPI